jgi:uncharacterized membrane protein
MNPSSVHIVTSWIPLYSLILSGLILSISLLFKRGRLFNFSMILLVFSTLIDLITGAFGGASMPRVRDLPDINYAALHLHAWSAFGAIAFAIVLAFLAILRFQKKSPFDTITNIVMVLIGLLCVAFLAITLHFAALIRM